MKKIDIHCHTTNRRLENIIPESASIKTLKQEMKKHEVEKTVLLPTYFPFRGTGISNYRLYDWIREDERLQMFGSLDFKHYFYQGYNELEELAEKGGIKGIKIYTSYQEIDLKSEKFKKIVELAQEKKLALMFHTGVSHGSTHKYGRPAYTEILRPAKIEFIPEDVHIILSHLAKPYFDELVEVVKRNKHIYADMSGLMQSRYESFEIPEHIETINRFLGECGPEKLLFGTDFPVQTHEHSVLMIEESMKTYSVQDKSKVYYENAERLLK